MHIHTPEVERVIQGTKDALDALSCGSLSAKEPLSAGLFCEKRPIKIMNPMPLHHLVSGGCIGTYITVSIETAIFPKSTKPRNCNSSVSHSTNSSSDFGST